ncbi:MAG: SOS response-associated peptidase [Gemmatimonadales bacterium]|nr:MAG: SOS response-associated peptidase [Gemmatimonadales bacterium]
MGSSSGEGWSSEHRCPRSVETPTFSGAGLLSRRGEDSLPLPTPPEADPHMCGRYSLTLDQESLNAALGVEGLLHPSPRWNVAPGQEVPALLSDRGLPPKPARPTWGLVPSWAREPARGTGFINARVETAHEKPSFREAFAGRRALVPADGFFEWRDETGGRTPWWIHLEGRVFTMAGLWESGVDGARPGFSILTRPAPPPMDRIHHRMPVLLPSGEREWWLRGSGAAEAVRDRLLALEPPRFLVRRVSSRVNRPEHDDRECIRDVGGGDGPPPPPEQTSLFSGPGD